MRHNAEFPNMTINLLECALDILGCRLPRDAVIHLPYCWHTVPGTTDMILLNRLYKPIGVTWTGAKVEGRLTYPGEHVDYADYPELMVPRDLVHGAQPPAEVPSHTPKDLALRAMFCNPQRDGYFDVCIGDHPGPDPRRWFYNDSTDPRRGKKCRQRLAGVIRDNLDALDDLP